MKSNIRIAHLLIAVIPILFISPDAFSQDTFSIIAIDSITGEIGSAGASCIGNAHPDSGVIVISTIIPGRGAINTQAHYLPVNQQYAKQKMLEGLSPAEIINWLKNNDAINRIELRQYGIMDINESGNIRVAAFTGVSCDAYKSHIIGKNYCIQGNILAGQFVLDSMEYAFNRTTGSLAEKLLAALQSAKIPGADTRCFFEGVSSKSAFIRVAKPKDHDGAFFLQLNVNNRPFGKDPIDLLQEKFNVWKRQNQRE